MIQVSSDGHRLTALHTDDGPIVAVADHDADADLWLVGGRLMSREHALAALQARLDATATSPQAHRLHAEVHLGRGTGDAGLPADFRLARAVVTVRRGCAGLG
jgi:hypothetical protein